MTASIASNNEELERLFRFYMGPVGALVFSELEKGGITKERVIAYIESMRMKGIIPDDSARKFRQEIERLMK